MTFFIDIPRRSPSVYVATAREMIITIAASLKNNTVVLNGPGSVTKLARTVVNAIKITGSIADKTLIPRPGSLSEGIGSALKIFNGTDLIFFNVLAKKGPATMDVGIPINIP